MAEIAASPFGMFEQQVKHFGKRGLDIAEIRKLNLEIVSWDKMVDILGFPMYPKSQADFIPFFDIDGGLLKCDNGRPALRFRRHLPEGAENKYLSPKNSGSFVYLPQLDNMDWPTVANHVDEPLVICEGEYKSMRACKMGITAVGLGGAWNFKSKKGELATPLDRFEWEGRSVCIAYDADKECTPEHPYKGHVDKASLQLASMLESRGAKVFVLYIARTKWFVEGVKMGLDDYFDAGGTWDALMETKSEPTMEPQLSGLMSKYAICLGSKPHVLNLSTLAKYTMGEFENTVEVNKVVFVDKKPQSVARQFKMHKGRPEFDEYDFDPVHESGLDQERRRYNTWPGFGATPARDEELEGVYLQFMKKMCGEHYDYIMSWFAHMVQKPWEKTTIALLSMNDVNGAGKSMLGEIHGEILGNGLYLNEGLHRVLSEQFNAQLANRLFVQCDESEQFYKGSEGLLKDIISNETITIEGKGRDAIRQRNLMRIFITTNSDHPLRLDSNNRRIFVWRPPVSTAEARGEWGSWIGTVVKRLKSTEEGRSAVMWTLMNWDLGNVGGAGTGVVWNPTAPVKITEEMQELADASPTKNETLGGILYDNCIAEGLTWCAVDPTLVKSDLRVWGAFKSCVEAGGGRKMAHQFTENKRNRKIVFFDLRGDMQSKMDASSKRWLEYRGATDDRPEGITTDQVKLSLLQMGELYSRLNGVVRQKYDT